MGKKNLLCKCSITTTVYNHQGLLTSKLTILFVVPLFILWFLSYPILLLQKWITNGKFVCILLYSMLSNILRTLSIVKENEKKLGKHLPGDLSEKSVQWFSKQNAQTSTINNTWDPVSRMCPEVHWGTVVNSQGHLGIPQNFKGLPATLDTCQDTERTTSSRWPTVSAWAQHSFL